MQTVYVDVLIMTNFIVDYFVLLLTAHILKCNKKRLRIFFASLIASLSSLIIFLPELNAFLEILSKLLISAIIILTAFSFKNKKRFLKATLLFYSSNFVIAGGAMALWTFFKPRGLIIRNGCVFYKISPLTLVVSTAVVYIISLIVSVVVSKVNGRGREYEITLKLNGKKVRLSGFVDSGNMLRDSISNMPVIVCDYEKIKPLLDEKADKVLSKKEFDIGFYDDMISSDCHGRFRVIPFDSLGDTGLMTGIVLDGAILHTKSGNEEIDNIIMAVTHKKIAGGEFDVILNPALVSI